MTVLISGIYIVKKCAFSEYLPEKWINEHKGIE
jgi:hypothetical protein